MNNFKRCSCCHRLRPLDSFWRVKANPPIWKQHLKKEKYYHKCKDCCLNDMDINNLNTVLPYFKDFNIPYIKTEWEKLKNKYYNINIFPRYLAMMKLCGYYAFQFSDSEKLNECDRRNNE